MIMNAIKFLVLSLAMVCFTSCQFSENIYINEDGSGTMEFAFDASELMVMAGDEMAKEGEQSIDSVMSFKELFDEKRDSISKLPKEKQEQLKALEPFKLHMVMNTEKQQMKFDLSTEFKNVNELQDMFETMSKLQELEDNGTANANPFSGMDQNNTKLVYNMAGNTFTRTATIINKELHQKAVDSLQNMSMMFASSKYKLNYHFPRKIKSVSNENAMFSNDRKSFTLEFGFMEYATNPEALNITVILED